MGGSVERRVAAWAVAAGLVWVCLMGGAAGCAGASTRSAPVGATQLSAPGKQAVSVAADDAVPAVLSDPSAGDIVTLSEPSAFDAEAASSLGLATNGSPNDLYGALWVMYRQVLSDWLLERLDLAGYDTQFAQSPLGFVTVAPEDGSFYQRHSRLGLSFIYLRNNTSIERLSSEDLEAFRERMSADDFNQDPALREIVERTYARVARIIDDDEVTFSGYDNSGSKNCENDALVFEISYAVQFDGSGNFVDRDQQVEQHLFAGEFAEEMATELTTQMAHPVAVFVVGEF
jgi:hypothetical protein